MSQEQQGTRRDSESRASSRGQSLTFWQAAVTDMTGKAVRAAHAGGDTAIPVERALCRETRVVGRRLAEVVMEMLEPSATTSRENRGRPVDQRGGALRPPE